MTANSARRLRSVGPLFYHPLHLERGESRGKASKSSCSFGSLARPNRRLADRNDQGVALETSAGVYTNVFRSRSQQSAIKAGVGTERVGVHEIQLPIRNAVGGKRNPGHKVGGDLDDRIPVR